MTAATMTRAIDDTTSKSAARTAGIGYLAIFVLAIFANFLVRQTMIDPTDAAATATNVSDSELLFRSGIAAFVVIFLVDVPVAWALYVVFRPGGALRSLLAAWFRIVYTVFLGVAAVFLFLGLQLVTAPAGGSGNADAGMLMFEGFNYTWLVGLIAFGVHLILLGRLIVKSGLAPKWIGWALTIAGVAYGIDTLAYTLLPDYASIAGVMLALVAIPSVIAELSFMVWLLLTGFKRSPSAAS
jgi:hypothetical protein